MKRKLMIISALLTVVLGFTALSGFTTLAAVDVQETAETPVTATAAGLERIEVQAVADGTDGGTQYAGVETPDGKKLYVNPLDNGVYTLEGDIVTDPVTGTAVNYMADAQEFKNAKGDKLTLLERSGGSVSAYRLGIGGEEVSAVKMEDNLFKFNVKAYTAYNRGAAYEQLFKIRVTMEKGALWGLFGFTLFYEYYDLRGHEIPAEYIEGAVTEQEVDFNPFTSLAIFWTIPDIMDVLDYTKQVNAAYYGTFANVLAEIRVEFEESDETEGFARNPVTGEFLRTQLGDKILLGTNFQLIDVIGWPLIGADAWPLFWDAEQKIYKNFSGDALTINENNELVDTGGKPAHSVIEDIIAGADLYCFYLADGKTYLPVTREPNQPDVYDLNGVKVDPNKVIMPKEFAEDDPPKSGLQGFLDGLFGDDGLTWLFIGLIVIAVMIAIWAIAKKDKSQILFFIMLGIAVVGVILLSVF